MFCKIGLCTLDLLKVTTRVIVHAICLCLCVGTRILFNTSTTVLVNCCY